ncbi:hypothetical protein [Litchfieldia salsa]|uniref:Uncharacterized protein n=1 Tax=Litchfieldia salsa TaxID=930152 RepID=A0A1H0RPQ2_9BACI|nr:hypothetical protein [Litchfieldia salsa]SDP31453.1 hypothetical protein SAMN05216565_102325 [Litchfieldia salsa]
MIIRSSSDIEMFMKDFNRFAAYDSSKNIYYFVFQDKERGGQLTLMQSENQWLYHGLGEGYCDPKETALTVEENQKFVWLHRKAINKSIKDSLITA